MLIQHAQVHYDLLALKDLATSLPADSAGGMDVLYAANQTINAFRYGLVVHLRPALIPHLPRFPMAAVREGLM